MSTKVIFRRAEGFFQLKSVFRDVRMQANLGLMLERKTKISCNGGRSVTKNLRARQDCTQTPRQTAFRQKNETSAELKITFVDLTYPGQRPEVPSQNVDKIHKCILVYKCLNNLAPPYFCDYFIRNNCIHSHNTRNRNDLHLPVPKLSLGKNTFRYSGSILFNKLPRTKNLLKQYFSR